MTKLTIPVSAELQYEDLIKFIAQHAIDEIELEFLVNENASEAVLKANLEKTARLLYVFNNAPSVVKLTLNGAGFKMMERILRLVPSFHHIKTVVLADVGAHQFSFDQSAYLMGLVDAQSQCQVVATSKVVSRVPLFQLILNPSEMKPVEHKADATLADQKNEPAIAKNEMKVESKTERKAEIKPRGGIVKVPVDKLTIVKGSDETMRQQAAKLYITGEKFQKFVKKLAATPGAHVIATESKIYGINSTITTMMANEICKYDVHTIQCRSLHPKSALGNFIVQLAIKESRVEHIMFDIAFNHGNKDHQAGLKTILSALSNFPNLKKVTFNAYCIFTTNQCALIKKLNIDKNIAIHGPSNVRLSSRALPAAAPSAGSGSGLSSTGGSLSKLKVKAAKRAFEEGLFADDTVHPSSPKRARAAGAGSSSGSGSQAASPAMPAQADQEQAVMIAQPMRLFPLPKVSVATTAVFVDGAAMSVKEEEVIRLLTQGR